MYLTCILLLSKKVTIKYIIWKKNPFCFNLFDHLLKSHFSLILFIWTCRLQQFNSPNFHPLYIATIKTIPQLLGESFIAVGASQTAVHSMSKRGIYILAPTHCNGIWFAQKRAIANLNLMNQRVCFGCPKVSLWKPHINVTCSNIIRAHHAWILNR